MFCKQFSKCRRNSRNFRVKKSSSRNAYNAIDYRGGFGFGVGYGRGALLINEATVDYYSAANASYGLQIGASQYAHVLFFMTENALNEFRNSSGWSAGGDIEYAYERSGESFRANTTEANSQSSAWFLVRPASKLEQLLKAQSIQK